MAYQRAKAVSCDPVTSDTDEYKFPKGEVTGTEKIKEQGAQFYTGTFMVDIVCGIFFVDISADPF